jgi:hypothetical protein
MSYAVQLPVFELLKNNFQQIQKLRKSTGQAEATYIDELIEMLTTLIDCARKGDESRAEQLATLIQSKMREFTS